MFTYYFIDNLGLRTTSDFAYDKDLEYLEGKVKAGEYQELVIVKRIF